MRLATSRLTFCQDLKADILPRRSDVETETFLLDLWWRVWIIHKYFTTSMKFDKNIEAFSKSIFKIKNNLNVSKI